MSRSSFLGLLCAVGALLASVPAAAGGAETKEYPVTMDWRIGYHSASTCASWGLATWREQEGAVAWKLLYYFSPPNPAYAGERSKTLSPPFDDAEFDQFGWKPAKGTHWHGLSYSGRSSGAGNPVSCDDLQAKQKALYSNVRIEITVVPTCTAVTNRHLRLARRLQSSRKGERRSKQRNNAAAEKVSKAIKRVEKLEKGGDSEKLAKARKLKRQAEAAAKDAQERLEKASQKHRSATEKVADVARDATFDFTDRESKIEKLKEEIEDAGRKAAQRIKKRIKKEQKDLKLLKSTYEGCS